MVPIVMYKLSRLFGKDGALPGVVPGRAPSRGHKTFTI